jgi:replication factor C large subunit
MKKQNWTEKYRPKYFLDVKNQELAVQTVKRFLMGFSMGEKGKRSVILHGPPGTGKTSLAHVAAAETSSEIFELNASDLRNKGKLIEVLRPATKQKSLIKKGKIILIDEVDGVAGNADRGGVLELLRIVETSNYPIIITANDIWDKKFSPLRRKSEIVQLKEIDYQTTKNILIDILRKENKFIPMDVLTNISIKAKGDLRAAINDLQTASQLENPADVVFDERNKEVDIFSAMRMIFKGSPSRNMLRIFDSVNMSMDEIILWMEENIPAEYQGEELAEAYERLSRVDIFKRRIYKQQYWRFLVYENALLSYGISSAKKSEKTGFTNYKKPTRILKIWLNNRRIEKKKSIAKKYAAHVHVGEKRALKEFPTIKAFLMKPGIQKELRLTREEIDYLGQKV